MQGTCPVPDHLGSTVGKMVFAGGALGWRGRGGPGGLPRLQPRRVSTRVCAACGTAGSWRTHGLQAPHYGRPRGARRGERP